MTLDDSMLAMRLRAMHRAQTLGNVSAACREAGTSRTSFYRWRQRFERYGPDGLTPLGTGRPPPGPCSARDGVWGRYAPTIVPEVSSERSLPRFHAGVPMKAFTYVLVCRGCQPEISQVARPARWAGQVLT
jgi:transposase-like protein